VGVQYGPLYLSHYLSCNNAIGTAQFTKRAILFVSADLDLMRRSTVCLYFPFGVKSPGVSVDLFMCSRDTGLSRETNAVEHHTVNPMNPMNYWEFGIVVKNMEYETRGGRESPEDEY
jgi:hypothetical protein